MGCSPPPHAFPGEPCPQPRAWRAPDSRGGTKQFPSSHCPAT
jgi:tetratricopeptide (TPR) repeat protein